MHSDEHRPMRTCRWVRAGGLIGKRTLSPDGKDQTGSPLYGESGRHRHALETFPRYMMIFPALQAGMAIPIFPPHWCCRNGLGLCQHSELETVLMLRLRSPDWPAIVSSFLLYIVKSGVSFTHFGLYREIFDSGPWPSEGRYQLVSRVVFTALHVLEAPFLYMWCCHLAGQNTN